MQAEIIDDWEQDDFYLTKDLNEKNIEMLDKILRIGNKSLRKFNRRIMEYTELVGKESRDITLRNEQVRPMLMSLITKRFFIGDEPGLGKTVMSAACYANYAYHMIKRGKEPSKVMVVTTSSHINSFAREWESYGIDILPLSGGSNKIEKTLNKYDVNDYDGIILNWDGLKTNGFLEHFMRNKDKYNYAVFDETSTLKKGTSVVYEVSENLINKYKEGIDRVIFLNGSSFESNLFDFYYQFKVLQPKLIPNKQFLEDNYVIRGGASHFAIRKSGVKGSQKGFIKKFGGPIIDYKNQDELRKRLQYYFLARSKKDYAGDIPENNYVLHEIELSAKQKKLLKEERSITILNSPETRDEKQKLTVKSSPKMLYLMDFIDTVQKDRPLIYVYNRKSQQTIKEELDKKGYKVEVINGSLSSEEKDEIVDKFNRYKLDVLVFNVQKALNIPTSDRIVLYDIPIMPHETRQIMGRIDRNNYDTPKFYDFLCYLESPEMENMIKLSLFRENQGSAFTGQENYVYKTIIDQLSLNYGEDVMEDVKERAEEDDDFFSSEEWDNLVDEIVG